MMDFSFENDGVVAIKDQHWADEFDIQVDGSRIDEHSGQWWADYFEKDTGFAGFMEDAYASEQKYSIRINPITKKKEMMVAGTDSLGNWAQNVAEGLKGTAAQEVSLISRYEGSDFYDEIAEREGVDVIYGHSRGAAHLTDMKYDATYVGIDGATSIGSKRPDMVNVIGDQAFDRIIGMGHKNTVHVHDRAFHNVTKSKVRAKAEKKAAHKKASGHFSAPTKHSFQAKKSERLSKSEKYQRLQERFHGKKKTSKKRTRKSKDEDIEKVSKRRRKKGNRKRN